MSMQAAYKLAAHAVRQRFAEQHPEYLEVLASLRKRDIAVYKGTYDSVESVLDLLGIPFTLSPRKLSASLVFANCAGQSNQALVEKIEPHVRDGAWLVTSDWSLHNVVERAFPNTVRRLPGKTTGDEVVSVEPALGSNWEEVVVLGTDPQWWLESASYLIDVLDPERVRIEAASHEMLVKYNAPAIAVRFDWEAGHVLHVISHFWLKRSRVPDERYRGPCTEFLKAGMRLSDAGIEKVLKESKVQVNDLNFAMIQSAATATELIAQTCVHSQRRVAAVT